MSGHDDFVERRRHRIGASDVAGALTGAFGNSPASVIARKLNAVADVEPTFRMATGLRLEDRLVTACAELLGVTVVDRQLEVASDQHPFLVATCDAVVSFDGMDDSYRFPLEVKTTSNPAGYPPDYLDVQLHAQMHCLDTNVGSSAVWNLVTHELTVGTHHEDPKITAAVLSMARTLWEHLCSGTIPAPTFPADSDLWNRLHPASVPGTVDLPAAVVEELSLARAEARQAQNRADVLEAEIKQLLGDKERGLVDGVPAVLWRTVVSHRLDTKTLQQSEPDIADRYRTETQTRRFTLVSPVKPQTRKGPHP
jgi:predicted phage-related endonuclease